MGKLTINGHFHPFSPFLMGKLTMENGWMIFDNDLQMVDFLCHWTLEGIAPSPAGFVRILIGKGHQFSMFSHEISIRVDEIHTKNQRFPSVDFPSPPSPRAGRFFDCGGSESRDLTGLPR
jgi:hypothetical protein